MTTTRVNHILVSPSGPHILIEFVPQDHPKLEGLPVLWKLEFDSVTHDRQQERIQVYGAEPLNEFVMRSVMNFVAESHLLKLPGSDYVN